MVKIYQTADYASMSRRAAHIIAAEVIRNPSCVLGLATGSTPVGAYKRLAEMVAEGDISFKNVKSVNLDEYKGLAPTHDQSYRYFMQDNLSTMWTSMWPTPTCPTVWPPTPRPSAPATMHWWSLWVGLICSCWVWAVTATSASMSPTITSPRRPMWWI